MNIEQTTASSYLPIEDYGVIGDLHSVALVGCNGSIDWCCLPRFDAPSVFGALLDRNKGGHFQIEPAGDYSRGVRHRQMYYPETNILMTRFMTADGVAEITDFMPVRQKNEGNQPSRIVRAVTVVRGTLALEMICQPAFNYARNTHTLTLAPHGAVFHDPDIVLCLSSSVSLEPYGENGVHTRFSLEEGQTVYFMLECTLDQNVRPVALHRNWYNGMFHRTMHFWQDWLSHCTYQGRWREQVQRSALVLKLLTYAPSGAIVAAPTTSLPESLGGNRNWDYRFTWIRDAAFTLYSLLTLGFTFEAEEFMGWLDKRCHEVPKGGTLQPMYGITGEWELKEFTLDHLEGYMGSAPVRIGNGAFTQKQLDIYGEMIDSIYIYNRHQDVSYDLWTHLCDLLQWLTEHWDESDEGIWEVRGGQKPFVHSRVMSWVAFDRALRIARHRGLPAPLTQWEETSSQIYRQIMEKGWNERKQSFVQYYGSDVVDASSLLMVLTRFCGPTDARINSMIDCIQRDLVRDAHVYRYDPRYAAPDGLGSAEGSFSPCSFWLVEALTRAGRLTDARLTLEKMLSYANHVGLYAEEIGPCAEALGNYPQAFTHLALISACYNMDRALNGTLLA